MKRKLYDSVPVHGPQGKNGPVKAYACANCMEFWAELSVALMWTGDSEYNKWFPHNRHQLLRHDPVSYSVLCDLWGLGLPDGSDSSQVSIEESKVSIVELLEELVNAVSNTSENEILNSQNKIFSFDVQSRNDDNSIFNSFPSLKDAIIDTSASKMANYDIVK